MGDTCARSVPDLDGEVIADDGDEVCVFSLAVSEQQPDTVASSQRVIYPVTGSVTVGRSVLPVSTADLSQNGRVNVFAVAVPQGTNATLALGAAGFSQRFSLTESRTVGSLPIALYRSSSDYEPLSSPARPECSTKLVLAARTSH